MDNSRRADDGTTGAGSPSKVKVCEASRSSSVREATTYYYYYHHHHHHHHHDYYYSHSGAEATTSAPLSASSSPTTTGMWNGSLAACPGVGGHACDSVSE